jgi:hypothetical protein
MQLNRKFAIECSQLSYKMFLNESQIPINMFPAISAKKMKYEEWKIYNQMKFGNNIFMNNFFYIQNKVQVSLKIGIAEENDLNACIMRLTIYSLCLQAILKFVEIYCNFIWVMESGILLDQIISQHKPQRDLKSRV